MPLATVFLGVIALSTLALAIGAGVAALAAARAVRRIERELTRLQEDVRPLLARTTVVAEDASRILALVASQVERADALIAEFTRRVDDVITLIETAIVKPAREGLAVVAALRAVIEVLRGARGARGTAARAEEEDALFIG